MKKLDGFEIFMFRHAVEVWDGIPPEAHPRALAYTKLFFDEQIVRMCFDVKDIDVPMIVHECIHATDFILDNIGARMGTGVCDSEVRAYIATFIFEKVSEILKKQEGVKCEKRKQN